MGDSALIVAEQLSAWFPNDLSIRRVTPRPDTVRGKTNRQLVPEVASFVAPETGSYRVEVMRLEHRRGPAVGPYAVWIEAILGAAERGRRHAALAADPRVAWLSRHMAPLRSID
ncbi:MAG: hypothetical protein R3266_04890, partial [Gemmatimonadota bacterium]|nr:hypothetical protein [Gemmatimonadota bacterium]